MDTFFKAAYRTIRQVFVPVALCAAVLSACGGAGEGGSLLSSITNSSTNTSTTALKSVSAVGAANGASCSLLNSDNHVLATAKAGANKVADFGKVNATAEVLVACSGGNYEDLSSGATLNGGTQHAVAQVSKNGATTVAVNVLTELAYRKAGGVTANVAAQSALVAKAFGMEGTDLATTQPVDLLSKAATADAAGRYGLVLAAISQAAKDLNKSEAQVMTMLEQNLADGALTGSGASLLKTALAHLVNANFNGNPKVLANVTNSAVAGTSSLRNTVWTAPGSIPTPSNATDGLQYNRIPLSQVITFITGYDGAFITENPVQGQTYMIMFLGRKLTGSTFTTTGMTCTGMWLEPNEEVYGYCKIDDNATTVTATVTQRGVLSQGGTPTRTWNVTPLNTCPVPKVTSMLPTTAYYNSTTIFTINGCGLSAATTAALAGANCTPVAGGTDTQRQYSCPVTNDRTQTQGNLVAGGNTTGTQVVTYIGLPISVTAITPSPLTAGGNGGNPTTITGTGFYNGMTVQLNGTTCTSSGTSNAAGTQLSNVNCSNVTIPNLTSVPATVNGVPIQVPVQQAPPPTISLTAPTPINVGSTGNKALATSNSSGAITYTSSNTAIATVNPTTGDITPLAAGTITITATQAAVPGVFSTGTATTSVEVKTVIPPPTDPDLKFQQAGPVAAVVGVNPTITNPATATACTNVIGTYNPPVTYVISPAGATVDGVGRVIIAVPGTYTIKASVPAANNCNAKDISYTLNVAKAPVTFAFVSQAAVNTTVNAVTTNPANVTGVAGFAVPTGAITYTSSNPGVATVDPNTGAVKGVAVGTTTINANYAGDINYASATAVPYTVTVTDTPPDFLWVSYTNGVRNEGQKDATGNWCAIKHPATGLIWENSSISFTDPNSYVNTYTNVGGGAAGDASWLVAQLNAANNGAGWCGYTAWRLPTQAELLTIVQPPTSVNNAWVNQDYFRNTAQAPYWTSTPAGTGNATVNFATGTASSSVLTTPNFLRLVRNN